MNSKGVKVTGGLGIGGAVGILVVWILEMNGVAVPSEPSVAIGVISTGLTNYIIRKIG